MPAHNWNEIVQSVRLLLAKKCLEVKRKASNRSMFELEHVIGEIRETNDVGLPCRAVCMQRWGSRTSLPMRVLPCVAH